MTRRNNPYSLIIRLALVQLTVALCSALATWFISADKHNALSMLIGGGICLLATMILAVIALRPFSTGQAQLYVRMFSRMQMIRLFASAALLILAIIWLQAPVYLAIGFVLVQLISWLIVFGRRATRRWYYG